MVIIIMIIVDSTTTVAAGCEGLRLTTFKFEMT